MWLSRVLEIEPLLVRKRQFLIIKRLLGVKVNMIYCNLTIFFDVHSGQKRMWSNSPFLVDVSSFFILFFYYSFRTRWFYILHRVLSIWMWVLYWDIGNLHCHKLKHGEPAFSSNISGNSSYLSFVFLGISWNSC